MAEFITVAVAHFLALISPGPDFFIIVSKALKNGSARACLTCFGIAVANGIYILFALIGFSLVREHEWVLGVLKYSGAAFLCYLGVMFLRSGKRELFDVESATEAESGWKLFTVGFMSGILNPKNQVFYITLYTLFISPETPFFIQSLYGVWMFSILLVWDVFVAFSVGNSKVKTLLNSYVHRVEQVSGVIIICLGFALAFG